jgi:hypothetical protein
MGSRLGEHPQLFVKNALHGSGGITFLKLISTGVCECYAVGEAGISDCREGKNTQVGEYLLSNHQLYSSSEE